MSKNVFFLFRFSWVLTLQIQVWCHLAIEEGSWIRCLSIGTVLLFEIAIKQLITRHRDQDI